MATKLLGKVDLFGLNAWGNNPGMDALYGAAIGGGTAAAVTIACEHSGNVKAVASSDAFGFLAGLAVSGGLLVKKSTRHAAYGGFVGAFLASGLPWIKRMISSAPTAKEVNPATAAAGPAAAAAAGQAAGLGLHQLQKLNGLGVHQLRQLNGHQIESVPRPAGVAGLAGVSLGTNPPVSLYGNQTQAMKSLRGKGGPMVSGLSASYGANLFGGGR